MLGWALLADTVPLYPLYALLFADAGLSGAQISLLFTIWSAVAFVTEVPSGGLADRWGRRGALIAAGVLQAGGFAVWTAWPDFAGFAAGFVLWGIGGSLISGAREALLYDGLAAVGAESEYPRINGWVHATELLAQLPAAASATVLYAVGGYELVGWTSVGTCLAAAALATRLPEPPRDGAAEQAEPGYLATVRSGVSVAAARPGLRAALVAAALVGGFDALDEYFPLITAAHGVATVAVPAAMLPITLAGALGAVLGGAASRLRPGLLAALLGVGMLLLGGSALVPGPSALVGVAVSYGGYCAVLVVVDARLQERIDSRSRATVTSVAGLGVEVATFGVYAAWAFGGVTAVAGVGLLVAVVLPRLLAAGRTRTLR